MPNILFKIKKLYSRRTIVMINILEHKESTKDEISNQINNKFCQDIISHTVFLVRRM